MIADILQTIGIIFGVGYTVFFIWVIVRAFTSPFGGGDGRGGDAFD
jgi:hypothetical protein